MKKLVAGVSICFLASINFFLQSCSRAVVVEKPVVAAAKAYPPKPSPRHIWVGDNWVWRNGRYLHVNGYWALPPRHHYWVEGYWKHKHKGWVWVPGYWR